MIDSSATTSPEPGLWQTFGPLAPYLLRPGVTDVFVTGTGELWTDDARDGLHREESWRADRRTARELAVRLIAAGGRHIDEATPFVDVRLRGGVRVHAVMREPRTHSGNADPECGGRRQTGCPVPFPGDRSSSAQLQDSEGPANRPSGQRSDA